MLPSKIDTIITEMSVKYGLPKQVIEEIYKSEFAVYRDTVKESITTKEFKNVMLPLFGKFYCNPVRLEIINTKRAFKLNKNGKENKD